jgi:S1-C subfamily serine protease
MYPRLIRGSVLACLVLVASNACAQADPEIFLRFYERKATNRAIAFAFDEKTWAAGVAWGKWTSNGAMTDAVRNCEQERVRRGIQAACQIHSVNGSASNAAIARMKEWYRANEELLAQARIEEEKIREQDRRLAPARTRERESSNETVSTGTGFLVSPHGHVLTANHVLRGRTAISVKTATGDVMAAQVLAVSQNLDVALLKIAFAATDFVALKHTPVRLESGDRVFTFGYPVTTVLGSEAKYSDGAISSVSGIQGDVAFLQVTVPIQPGNSGGPLVREDGTLVGVISSSAAIVPFIRLAGTLPQNINWATNINAAMPLLLDVPTTGPTQNLDRASLLRRVKRSVVYIEARREAEK